MVSDGFDELRDYLCMLQVAQAPRPDIEPGLYPLQCAARAGHLAAIQFLLHKWNQKHPDGGYPHPDGHGDDVVLAVITAIMFVHFKDNLPEIVSALVGGAGRGIHFLDSLRVFLFLHAGLFCAPAPGEILLAATLG